MRKIIILLGLFALAQLIGLAILTQYIDFQESSETGKTSLEEGSYLVEPISVENESLSFVTIFLAILIGTGLVLAIIHYGKLLLWKIWFFASVFVALLFAFWPFVQPVWATIILTAVIAGWKVFRPNLIIHNITELFIYGGIAAIFVPIINLFSAVILLILIAIYDYWMVYKAKHMVTLAKSQLENNMVAGIMVGKPVKAGEKIQTKGAKQAMVGGGDVAFPLFFAGAVMKSFGTPLSGILIVAGATLGLGYLLFSAKPEKFYPAMPYIAIGCFLGLGIVLLL